MVDNFPLIALLGIRGERMVPFEALNPDIACEVLAEAGLEFAPSDVHVEAREERWVVRVIAL